MDREAAFTTEGEPCPSSPMDLRGKEGVALVRGEDGSVRRMIWNATGVSFGPVDDAFFLAMVRTSDAKGIARMLEATGAAAFVGCLDIDLGLASGDGRIPAGLIACRFGPENLLLVGTSDRAGVVRLFEPLMEMAFEDAGHLRELLCEARDRLSSAEASNRALSSELALLRREVERLRATRVPRAGASPREAPTNPRTQRVADPRRTGPEGKRT